MGTDGSLHQIDKAGLKAPLKALPFQIPSLIGTTRGSFISLTAFCILAISIVSAQSTTKTVRHHRIEEQDPIAVKINEAEQNIDKQDYAAAEALLKQAVAEAPENYSAWYDLGFVYHAMGRRDDSISAYRKSVAAKPDVFESNLNLGLALADSGQADAEQFLRAATKLTPTSNPAAGRKRAWVGLGHLLEAGKPDEAASAYQQASLADPKDPEPHLLAATLLEKQHPADAEKEYQQALALAPESPDALAALTNFYMRQRRFGDAEALLRKLVAVHPNDATAHLQLGRMLAISGNTGDGISELESGLKLDPSDTQAQHDLADLYLETSKFSQAEGLYKSLIASHPNDAAFHHGLGRALLSQKKYADAERELARTVQLKPDFGPAYGDLAVAAAENKDYEFAIKAVDMRAKFLPEIPITYFLRATAYDNLHDVKDAARYYHQFLDVAGGKFPDQEWQARHRLIAIEPKK
jgi:tetratricopeptide (TPR) repeat protein